MVCIKGARGIGDPKQRECRDKKVWTRGFGLCFLDSKEPLKDLW